MRRAALFLALSLLLVAVVVDVWDWWVRERPAGAVEALQGAASR